MQDFERINQEHLQQITRRHFLKKQDLGLGHSHLAP